MKEFYTTLPLGHKWNKIVTNFKVGGIVLLLEKTSRSKRPMSRVTIIQKGSDDFVRYVNIVATIL